MFYQNLSSTAPICDFAATHSAPNAERAAARARKHIAENARNKALLDSAERQFGDKPLLFYVSMFVLAVALSIYIGWELYRAIVKVLLHFEPHPLGIAAVSLVVSAFSALTGHFLVRGWNRSVQNWVRERRRSVGQHEFLDEMALAKEFGQSRIIGLICLAGAAGLFFLLAETRENAIYVINRLHAERDSIFLLFPLGLFLIELITGEWFLLWCLMQKYRIAVCWHSWLSGYWQKTCVRHDHETIRLWQDGQRKGEKYPMTTDVRNALYRMENRCTGDLDYVDPLPDLRDVSAIRLAWESLDQ